MVDANLLPLDKEGPIHDVSWSPNSKEFGVVYGYMPSKTTIFNTRAVATHSFPLKPRNTILFSPHGRFVLVAGFGNLAGQTDIYDLEKDFDKVCTIEASNASVCEWSPDGKHILTATTSPRLRVDNGVRIWHVTGSLMYNEDLNELYHVVWRPQPTNTHPLVAPLGSVPAPHASALKYLGTVKTPSKPAGAYRPPGARGQITPLAFRREDEGGAAYVRDGTNSFSSNINGFGKARRRDVPGAEAVAEPLPPGAAPGGGVSLTPGAAVDGDANLSKSAAKNKKKREAKKAKDQAEKSDTLAPELSAPRTKSPSRSPERKGGPGGRGHERSRSKGSYGYTPAPGLDGNYQPRQYRDRSRSTNRRQRADTQPHGQNGAPVLPAKSTPQPKPSINTSLPPPPPPTDTPELQVTSPTTPGSGGGTAQEKKVRGLLKKIRAIDDLKMRLAGGEKLEDTQMKKIKTEEAVRKELHAVEPDA